MTSRLYDPHQLRQKANRYYQRKGQILQVKEKNSDFGMVTRKQAAKMKPYVDAYFPSSPNVGISFRQSSATVHPLIKDGQIITIAFSIGIRNVATVNFQQSPDQFTPGDIRIFPDRMTFFFGTFSQGFLSFYTDAENIGYQRCTSDGSWIYTSETESVPFDFHVGVVADGTNLTTNAFIYSITNL